MLQQIILTDLVQENNKETFRETITCSWGSWMATKDHKRERIQHSFQHIGFIILPYIINNYQQQYIFDSFPSFITTKIQLASEKFNMLANPGGLVLWEFVYMIL